MDWLIVLLVLLLGLAALWGLHQHQEWLIAKAGYYAYLESPRWRRKRQECFKAFGGRCAICHSPYNLQAHHRRYDHLYHEKPIRDLTCLCRDCYSKAPRSRELYKG